MVKQKEIIWYWVFYHACHISTRYPWNPGFSSSKYQYFRLNLEIGQLQSENTAIEWLGKWGRKGTSWHSLNHYARIAWIFVLRNIQFPSHWWHLNSFTTTGRKFYARRNGIWLPRKIFQILVGRAFLKSQRKDKSLCFSSPGCWLPSFAWQCKSNFLYLAWLKLPPETRESTYRLVHVV